MIPTDKIYCIHCGMKKHKLFTGNMDTDMATIHQDTVNAKCCEDPMYLWVL